MESNLTEMVLLGLSDREIERYNKHKVHINKSISSAFGTAKRVAKAELCFSCKKRVSSFCNSHSIPRFCLRKIAQNGLVFSINKMVNLPFFESEVGLNKAGTFNLICNQCDNTLFSEYENPENYASEPTVSMLAQIAMKNYLQMIYKRNVENPLYRNMRDEKLLPKQIHDVQQEVIRLDNTEYHDSFNRAKLATKGNHDDWYYLCYYQRLDYIVPIAFQGGIVLISDFEDTVVNDIYNMNANYHTEEIHIAIFPLENESVVMAFVDTRNNRYRNFYKQLRKLSLEQQLATINFIVFAYSENVFLSKNIPDEMLNNKEFIKVCKATSNAITTNPYENPIFAAIEIFSLGRRNSIPNLLSKEHCLVNKEAINLNRQ